MRYFFERILSVLPKLYSLLIPDSWKGLKKCDVLLCCSDAHRYFNFDGKAYSPWLDSLAQDLVIAGWKVERLANWGSVLVEDEAYGAPKSANRMIFWYKVIQIIKFFFGKYATYIIKYSRCINPYDRILEKTGCRCILAIGSDDILCQSARAKGIHIIEMLHGIGYTPLPWGWDKLSVASLPTGILSMDSVSTKTFKILESKGITVKQINHPWIRNKGSSEKCKYVSELNKKLEENQNQYKKKILISLAPGYDGEEKELCGIIRNGVIPEAIIDSISDTQDDVFWFLRLHQQQRMKAFRYRRHRRMVNSIVSKFKNTESLLSSQCKLNGLLRECTGHITMCSMTSYEAAYMGVPTLLLCPTLGYGKEYEHKFSDLKDEGYAELNINPNSNDVTGWVKTSKQKKKKIYGNEADDWKQIINWMLGDKYGESM